MLNRKVQMILALLMMIAVHAACTGAATQSLRGLYVNYEGAEYENVVVECSSGRVWNVGDNDVLAAIQAAYKVTPKSEYGEVLVELQGEFRAYDRDQFPNSHEFGEFVATSIVRVWSDSKELEECRSAHISRE